MNILRKNIDKTEGEYGENNSELNYFKNKYLIDIHAVLSGTIDTSDGVRFSYLELNNLATESIISEIENKENEHISVVKGFPNFVINNDKEKKDAHGVYIFGLKKLCEKAKEEGKTLILGFSSMGGYELLPKLSEELTELLGELEKFKLKYENLI